MERVFQLFSMTASTFARLVVRGAISNRDPCKVTLKVSQHGLWAIALDCTNNLKLTRTDYHNTIYRMTFPCHLRHYSCCPRLLEKQTQVYIVVCRMVSKQSSLKQTDFVNGSSGGYAAFAIVAAHLPSTHVWQPSQTTGKQWRCR